MRKQNQRLLGAIGLGAGAYYYTRAKGIELPTADAFRTSPATQAPAPPTPAPATPAPHPGTPSSTGTNDPSPWDHIQSAVGKVGDLIHVVVPWVGDHWHLMGGAALALIVLAFASSIIRGDAPTDPQRAFTASQRTEGFERAGGRCEMTSWGLFRCSGPAEHADHHYPWSKGGASSLENLVAACQHHNLAKGARLPSRLATRRITRRRRGYFPAGVPTRPGARVPRGQSADVVVDPAA